MGETIPRPDVLVEQVFEAPAPTLIPPNLPVVIIGTNTQIEFRQSGGDYDHLLGTAFSYPNLISGGTVTISTVEVHLVDDGGAGVFELLPADLTITSANVAVGAFSQTVHDLVKAATTGAITDSFTITDPTTYDADGVSGTSDLTFTSAGSTFLADGVRPGQTLFLIDGADAGRYEVASITNETDLIIKATPWTGFTAFTGSAATTFYVGANYATFTDNTIDFLKAKITPQKSEVQIGTTDTPRTRMLVERIQDDDELWLVIEYLFETGGGDSTISTGTFVDSTTPATFITDKVAVGDQLVIDTGTDTGIFNIDSIDSETALTVSPNFSAGDTGAAYHISAAPPVAAGLTYDVEETDFERSGTALITYNASRIDNVNTLVQVQTTDDITNVLGPAVLENPIALATFLASLNTETTVFALAIPDNTLASYTSALDLLETEEVYSLIPLTQDAAVHQAFAAHVTQQSDVDSKHERITFINKSLFIQATRTNETDATSGIITDNTSPVNDTYTDSGQDFVVDGVISGDEITFSHLVAGDTVSETTRVLSRDSATDLTLADGLTASFITAWNGGASQTITIKSAALDKFEQASFIADTSAAFANRRVHNTVPDLVEVTFTDNTKVTTFKTQDELDGTDSLATGDRTEIIAGTFLCSAIGGQVAGEDPQQPFTNLPLTGIVGLRNSNKYFTSTQLDIIATGGTYIVIQDIEDAPVFARHQLSTDVTQIEKRELSITKNVDFIAKFFRNSLRPYIGRFNITKIYMEQLRTVGTGIVKFLTSNGQLITGEIVKLEQSDSQPDTVLLDVDLLVPFPANFIRVTLLI